LNISRCISTAAADEEIDLQTVNAEMLSLEQKITETKDKHSAFLKELGLPPLLDSWRCINVALQKAVCR
jgi:type I restriction enzyme M protein